MHTEMQLYMAIITLTILRLLAFLPAKHHAEILPNIILLRYT